MDLKAEYVRARLETAPSKNIAKILVAPDQAGGGANFDFAGAQIAGVDVISLHAPGKILETPDMHGQFAVHAAAKIDGDGVIGGSIGGNALETSQGVNKWSPVSVCLREAWSEKEIVLGDAGAVEAAGVEGDAEIR